MSRCDLYAGDDHFAIATNGVRIMMPCSARVCIAPNARYRQQCAKYIYFAASADTFLQYSPIIHSKNELSTSPYQQDVRLEQQVASIVMQIRLSLTIKLKLVHDTIVLLVNSISEARRAR